MLEIHESYDPTANVVGSTLVGLRLGKLFGKLDPSEVRVAAPRSVAEVCLRAVTQDGRYTSSTDYVADEANAPLWVLRPLTVKHVADLAQYAPEQLAIHALADSCGRATIKSMSLPHITDMDGPLFLLVNAQSRSVRAKLLSQDMNGAPVLGQDWKDCMPVGGERTRIAFDVVCSVPVLRGQDVVAELELDDGFGIEALSFGIRMPE